MLPIYVQRFLLNFPASSVLRFLHITNLFHCDIYENFNFRFLDIYKTYKWITLLIIVLNFQKVKVVKLTISRAIHAYSRHFDFWVERIFSRQGKPTDRSRGHWYDMKLCKTCLMIPRQGRQNIYMNMSYNFVFVFMFMFIRFQDYC